MLPLLLPCTHCRRHVRATEPTCPFCHLRLARLSAARVVPDPPRRMGRAERFAFAMAFLAGCQPEATAPDAAEVDATPAVDAGATLAADAATARIVDAATPSVDVRPADASVVACDVGAPDASAPRRRRPRRRPRLPEFTVQPCYGVPFVD